MKYSLKITVFILHLSLFDAAGDADRFVRTSFYIHAIPQTSDAHRAVASACIHG